ncbi:hypothetical protein MKW94_003289 [Papaver nudicaule]|uniref:Uncharacterized protein n=1 Tax=Papaver nudicaule TaxID=74823 RepID=A0AA42APU6_PAPNU|nr:hypothetical protein [Papaver nudicaule]
MAKPGKVVGPVVPYENSSSIRDAYDPRTYIRNAVLPPQPIPSTYGIRRTNGMVNQEKSVSETERDISLARQSQLSQCNMMAKLAPEVAIDINSSHFYLARAGLTSKIDQTDNNNNQIAIDTNLLQAKSQFGEMGVAAAAAAAARRKVSTVQYGMSRMY